MFGSNLEMVDRIQDDQAASARILPRKAKEPSLCLAFSKLFSGMLHL